MRKRNLYYLLAAILVSACNATQGSGRTTLSGEVERVWEDGFRLNTGQRSVTVDSWDVFGDNTRSQVRVGQRVNVSGEMSGGEFDASSITIAGEGSASQRGASAGSGPQAEAGRETLTGTIERVWEDGFRLNTGQRTVNVDSWDIFGDNTRSRVSAGQRVRVSGEMSGGEFDATAVNPL
ncbi:DUF5666 domain-containing protein [uncultured Thiohalocapsa sp.]|uniref:DUF5666 domain-containing protein n=1 Tax=uncultured Thiohalocapsa sp. TaxID=768990 RepID=UPI0025F4BD48|nr:DUF5666 domain-containing protein [uncultured Thiohalocapsa sp.]